MLCSIVLGDYLIFLAAGKIFGWNLLNINENSMPQLGNTLLIGFPYPLLNYDLLVTATAQYRSNYKNRVFALWQ
jgi:glycosyltransferase A (GT-A) superfamily protein (DUF2064 family)